MRSTAAEAGPSDEPTALAQSLPQLEQPADASAMASGADEADADLHHEPGGDDQPPAAAEGTATDEPAADGEQQPKHWGKPYKATFTSTAGGFEVGEDRRFKQVVFQFRDRPEPDVIDKLKAAGFKYRSAEKAWTVPATAATRELAYDLATELYKRAGGIEMSR